MALEDVAKLCCPRSKKKCLSVIRCFSDRREVSMDDMKKETEMAERAVRAVLTKLRKYRLVKGLRTVQGYRYRLTPDGFHAVLDTVYHDPVKHL